MANKPGVLTSFCVIAIILAALGFLTGVISAVNLVRGGDVPDFTGRFEDAATDERLLAVQADIARDIHDLTAKWFGISWTLLAVKPFVIAGLLVGSVLALRLRPAGRATLWYACVFALLFEILEAIPTVGMSYDTIGVMDYHMPRIVAALSSPPGQETEDLGKVMIVAMKTSMVLSLVFAVGGVLLKLGFYMAGVLYLRRPKLVALFSPLPDAAEARVPRTQAAGGGALGDSSRGFSRIE